MFRFIGGLVLAVAAASSSDAALVLSAESVAAAPNGSGFIQVFLQNNSATSVELSAFSIEVSVGPSGVFTDISDQTTPAYVFAGVGTGILTFDTFPTSDLIISDLVQTPFPDNFVTLAPGATYGLARIAFTVTSGSSSVDFVTANDLNQFVDPLGGSLVIDQLVSGHITAQQNSAVPEPGSLSMFAIGVLSCVIGAAVRKQRRDSQPSVSTRSVG